MAEPILSIRDLHTEFFAQEGTVRAVDGVSFDVFEGRTLGVVGESGCGKSVTARSILRIVEKPGRIVSGQILLRPAKGGAPTDLLKLSEHDMRAVRGPEIALVFQEPMASFSQYYTIGNQIMESVRLHMGLDKHDARARAIELLDMVGVPQPSRRVDEYPFELSGGLRQRVMIAMALMCDPELLIADEPTTALDVTVQAQILRLLQRLQRELGLALLLITHELGIVARMAQRVSVMYAGQVVESGPVSDLFAAPSHPYTRGLLACIPVPGTVRRGDPLGSIPGVVPRIPPGFVGCGFRDRCASALQECAGAVPLRQAGDDHSYLCRLTPNEARP